jgi:hypothetical protein
VAPPPGSKVPMTLRRARASVSRDSANPRTERDDAPRKFGGVGAGRVRSLAPVFSYNYEKKTAAQPPRQEIGRGRAKVKVRFPTPAASHETILTPDFLTHLVLELLACLPHKSRTHAAVGARARASMRTSQSGNPRCAWPRKQSRRAHRLAACPAAMHAAASCSFKHDIKAQDIPPGPAASRPHHDEQEYKCPQQ